MTSSRRCLHARVGALLGVLLSPFTPSAAAQGIGFQELQKAADWGRETYLLSEVLEYAPDVSERPVRYDLVGWAGGAVHRVWLKADGEHGTRGGSRSGSAELQVLYGRLVTPFWDAQLGLRVDAYYREGRARTFVALGVQGLAPGWFELEPTLFVSQGGDVSASLTASYDVLFTQRLVVQPRLETRAALQEVPEFGVGTGFNDLELGLRARYELRRELAPYVGVLWSRRFSETADLARASGAPVREVSWVAGLRVWR